MAKGLSLHIGLNEVDPNHYGGWSGPLSACEYDAQDMQSIAQARGFETVLLLTANGTRQAVTERVRQAGESLDAGDTFLLTYSGHGGQVPDWNDDEADAQDETWCLFDGQLIDDELYALWAKFKPGVRILVFSDSCHSGTVTREHLRALRSAGLGTGGADLAGGGANGMAYRVMPDEAATRTYRANRAFYDKIQTEVSPEIRNEVEASILLVSGCQDNQLSLDGTFNGLFTGQLLRVWRDGQFSGNHRQFHRAILDRMPPTQSPNYFMIGAPNPEFEAQTPFTV